MQVSVRERVKEKFRCTHCAGSGRVMIGALTSAICQTCDGFGVRRIKLDEIVAFVTAERDAENSNLLQHLKDAMRIVQMCVKSQITSPEDHDAVVDLVGDDIGYWLASVNVDAVIAHERQRAVEICDLTLGRMIDRDACARAIRDPETKYPSAIQRQAQ